jgi:hypothetical protein
VRALAAGLSILLLLPIAKAQEQERRLVDRLLRPDMTLQNNAQNKKFVTMAAAQDRQARVSKFYWQDKKNAKTFSNMRDFSSQQFNTRSFYRPKDSPSFAARTASRSDLVFGTHDVAGVRDVADGGKKINGQDFAGNRPFLGQGKSQKALSQQDRPLTIEEVRELLNKNK